MASSDTMGNDDRGAVMACSDAMACGGSTFCGASLGCGDECGVSMGLRVRGGQ